MSKGVNVQGVSVQGVSDQGVCVLGVSVRGVHVRGGGGGSVLSPLWLAPPYTYVRVMEISDSNKYCNIYIQICVNRQ